MSIASRAKQRAKDEHYKRVQAQLHQRTRQVRMLPDEIKPGTSVKFSDRSYQLQADGSLRRLQ